MFAELKRRGCIAVALHPGTVNTGLSGPFQVAFTLHSPDDAWPPHTPPPGARARDSHMQEERDRKWHFAHAISKPRVSVCARVPSSITQASVRAGFLSQTSARMRAHANRQTSSLRSSSQPRRRQGCCSTCLTLSKKPTRAPSSTIHARPFRGKDSTALDSLPRSWARRLGVL